MLAVRGLESGYKRSAVLQGVDLDVAAGQVLGLLGRNGVGKSTLINTLMGLVPPSRGTMTLDGVDLAGRRPDVIARAGVALVPQGRRVWAPLSVTEHLAGGDVEVDPLQDGAALVAGFQTAHLEHQLTSRCAGPEPSRKSASRPVPR